MRYSIEPKDKIYVKGYGFLSFAKKMGKHLSSKYSQKLFDSAKKSKGYNKNCFKKSIQKTGEATGDLIGNKIADKITSISKKSSMGLHSKKSHSKDELEVPKNDTYLF